MAIYNLTNLTSSQTLADVAVYGNSVTNGILFSMGSVVIFFIILLALMKSSEFIDALIVSSFISFILSGVFVFGGYMSVYLPLFYLIVVAFSGFMILLRNK